jgi:hypothetical protein
LPEPDPLKPHFDAVVKAMLERRVIPFLGAGASLCDQPDDVTWEPSQERIVPSSEALTTHLAQLYAYPEEGPSMQLARVSQYAAVVHGLGPLYDTLQEIFDKDYQPTILHEFFATLPKFFRERKIKQDKNPVRRRMVIVTTNYDDLLEKAFEKAKEPYHKLVYMAEATQYENDIAYPGRFLHWTPDGKLNLIKVANDHDDLEEYERRHKVEPFPVIVKIHGAVDRAPSLNPNDTSAVHPSYVITEDHYIDYLTQADFFDLVPKSLGAALKKNNFLFLGYRLQDWNLRVILRRIWKEQMLGFNSWAVQLNPSYLDERYWSKQNVEIVNMDLGKYIRNLDTYMK